jgi:hypothetical protein
VDQNRFYSDTAKRAIYNISNVNKGTPLILVLKSGTNFGKLLREGLLINFEGKDTHVLCEFHKLTDLCVVTSIPEDLKMVIECKHLPCEAEWVIYQPQPKEIANGQVALNLYSLQNTTHHLIG